MSDIVSLYQTSRNLIANGEFDKAITQLNKCIENNPVSTDAILLLARVYLQTSQLSKALDTYINAKSIDRFKAESIAGIAKTQRLLGNVKFAYQFIHEETEKSPTLRPPVVLALSEVCLELGLHTEAITNIESLLKQGDINSIDIKKDLLHTLGKLYDKNNNFKQAFISHQLANELTPRQYKPQQFENLISRIQTTYSAESIHAFDASTIKGDKPIFIVGMPRSGSTLLEQILSCHSKIYGAGESHMIQQLLAHICDEKYPEQMRHIKSKTLNKCARYYLDEVCSLKHQHTIDKMPHNYLHIGAIMQLFPNSKIINITRNPVDNCLSIYFQYFNNSHRYATNLSDISHHYAKHVELVKYWENLFPENIIEIKYEDIVMNTQHEITRTLHHLGLDWEPGCLHHTKNKRHVLTASQQQVNKPIYTKSIKRWKNYEPYISELLNELKKHELV